MDLRKFKVFNGLIVLTSHVEFTDFSTITVFNSHAVRKDLLQLS